ncbi:hypothetical protein ACYULU_12845 [Breznakiellaceae bacterium SP9]
MKRWTYILLALLLLPGPVFAQNTGTEASDFPQWAHTLRRGEIIAFGSFPFTLYLASIGMDSRRTARHGGDTAYLPWPFKPANGPDRTNREHLQVLGLAAVGSVAFALIDYFLISNKRSKAAAEEQSRVQAVPDIDWGPYTAPDAQVEGN